MSDCKYLWIKALVLWINLGLNGRHESTQRVMNESKKMPTQWTAHWDKKNQLGLKRLMNRQGSNITVFKDTTKFL